MAEWGRPVGRARVARPDPRRVRGTAPRPDVSTRAIERPDPTAPIFVDHSGRRGRVLRRVVTWLIVIALLLLALWWLSQASVVA